MYLGISNFRNLNSISYPRNTIEGFSSSLDSNIIIVYYYYY